MKKKIVLKIQRLSKHKKFNQIQLKRNGIYQYFRGITLMKTKKQRDDHKKEKKYNLLYE